VLSGRPFWLPRKASILVTREEKASVQLLVTRREAPHRLRRSVLSLWLEGFSLCVRFDPGNQMPSRRRITLDDAYPPKAKFVRCFGGRSIYEVGFCRFFRMGGLHYQWPISPIAGAPTRRRYPDHRNEQECPPHQPWCDGHRQSLAMSKIISFAGSHKAAKCSCFIIYQSEHTLEQRRKRLVKISKISRRKCVHHLPHEGMESL
jgi:hypothetical protein